ncbi:NosD domain-containing protein [Accumulibacter sp.]|uniref:NosD domain-containing protein n=1 Tax=Accumulibacter sp. TaxID=2053492 RepID=UPI0028C4124A|nr:NosD domain-containing protein [Accumulibacter sp.]
MITPPIVIDNHICSRHQNPADRSDWIRLRYRMGNRIEDDDIAHIRDITVSNSLCNRFVGNSVHDSRRALKLFFLSRTRIESKRFSHHSAGITVLNSDGVIIRHNQMMHAVDANGAYIALKKMARR